MFDISELKRKHRDAFRWKLKDLGFRYLQKSAWICPYECRDEIELLKSFFGLKTGSVIVLTAQQIDNEDYLRQLFKL